MHLKKLQRESKTQEEMEGLLKQSKNRRKRGSQKRKRSLKS